MAGIRQGKWQKRAKTAPKPLVILDAFLDLLKDGEWHGFYEIETTVPLPTAKIIALIDFLEIFNFVVVMKDYEGSITDVRLVQAVAGFIQNISKIE